MTVKNGAMVCFSVYPLESVVYRIKSVSQIHTLNFAFRQLIK
jgi:hypothetical protein